MKILLAGGGTGGHFYPLIAVARSLRDLAQKERLVGLELTFVSDRPYDEDLLRAEEIKFMKVEAGKIRRYFSILNFTDVFKTAWGVIRALWKIYLNFPDVIFTKGGYASFPVLVAAKIFRIPLLIHSSDIIPGRVELWASRFAKGIAISFPQTLKYFPESKVALTGNPVRREILGGNIDEANEIFSLEPGLPTLLVLGGSQGSQKINDIVVDILPEILGKLQVIHQAGEENLTGVRGRASVVLDKRPELARRYHAYAFLNEDKLRNASKAASLVLSRAGAGHIFEIAAWGRPSILIPLPHAAQDHQRGNAYAYARAGAAVVIEETNLAPHILLSELNALLGDRERRDEMSKSAQSFAKIDAAEKIAREIINLGIHE